MERCVITSKSLTSALKAKDILADSAVYANIIKIDPSYSKHGCSYGLEIDCRNKRNAEKMLSASKLQFSIMEM